MIKVQDAEPVFLSLVAKRVLNYQRKAEEKNEIYNDLQPLTQLQCGYAAKLRFVKGPAGQLRPELWLLPPDTNKLPPLSEEKDIANRLMGGPAYFMSRDAEGRALYCLEKDR